VLVKVVAPHEALPADIAPELLLPSVRAMVTLQLIRTCEPLPTVGPVALEGAFPRVPAEMSPQVRRLAIDLPAARVVANVLLLLRGALWVHRACIHAEHAVWACAGHPSDSLLLCARALDVVAARSDGGWLV